MNVALIIVGLGLLLLGLFVNSIIRISTISYGVVTFFGRRTTRILPEGIHLVWPLGINKVEKITFDLRTTDISEGVGKDTGKLKVFSKDNVDITLAGSVQHRPAKPGTFRDDGMPLLFNFLEAAEAAISGGLRDAIRDALGSIAGCHDANEFIAKREALVRIINSYLKLKIAPHADEEFFTANKLTLKKLPLLWSGQPVAPGDRIEFYEENAVIIDKTIRSAFKDPKTISPLEERYGIDIETFALASIAFDEKTTTALGEARRQQAENTRIAEQANALMATFESLTKPKGGGKGLSDKDAAEAAKVLVGITSRVETSEIRGLSGGGTLPIINLGGPAVKPTTTTPKGGS
ncbi:MAG: SPFH domain-containing protein [Patescibacteria group bacterium]